MPAQQRHDQGRVAIHSEQRLQLRKAPLPTPEELAAFETVLPGLAGRITAMAEGHARNQWKNDGAHRFVAVFGQVAAFIVAMSIIVTGGYLTLTGHPVSGLTAVFGTIAAIVLAIRGAKRNPPAPNDAGASN